MMNCLPASGLRQLGDSAIADFDKRIASIPNTLCAPFHAEARQLEAALLMIYNVAVLCVKEEEVLENIASAWQCMVIVCDQFAARLRDLSKSHPFCGAQAYYDTVLDLRNKCQRLQQMHS
jgi:hypothetical protein